MFERLRDSYHLIRHCKRFLAKKDRLIGALAATRDSCSGFVYIEKVVRYEVLSGLSRKFWN
jgi:hypothetical protein